MCYVLLLGLRHGDIQDLLLLEALLGDQTHDFNDIFHTLRDVSIHALLHQPLKNALSDNVHNLLGKVGLFTKTSQKFALAKALLENVHDTITFDDVRHGKNQQIAQRSVQNVGPGSKYWVLQKRDSRSIRSLFTKLSEIRS